MTTYESGDHHAAPSALETSIDIDELHAREAAWGGMRAAFETYHETFDDAELLVGLPDDRCQCPHWATCSRAG